MRGKDPAQNIRMREESARQMLTHVQRLSRRYPWAPLVVGGNLIWAQLRFRLEQERRQSRRYRIYGDIT